MAKPKIAFYWCASCGGCEESIVDLAEDILKVVEGGAGATAGALGLPGGMSTASSITGMSPAMAGAYSGGAAAAGFGATAGEGSWIRAISNASDIVKNVLGYERPGTGDEFSAGTVLGFEPETAAPVQVTPTKPATKAAAEPQKYVPPYKKKAAAPVVRRRARGGGRASTILGDWTGEDVLG